MYCVVVIKSTLDIRIAIHTVGPGHTSSRTVSLMREISWPSNDPTSLTSECPNSLHSLSLHSFHFSPPTCCCVSCFNMASKPSEYIAFLPNSLLTVVNSKAFVPFILSNPLTGNEISLAAIAATQHQRHADLLYLPETATFSQALDFFRQYDITAVPIVSDVTAARAASGLAGKQVRKVGARDIVGIFTIADLIRPLISHSLFDQAPAAIAPSPSSAPSTVSSSAPSTASSSSRLSEAEFVAQLAASPLLVESCPAVSVLQCVQPLRVVSAVVAYSA